MMGGWLGVYGEGHGPGQGEVSEGGGFLLTPHHVCRLLFLLFLLQRTGCFWETQNMPVTATRLSRLWMRD